MKSDFLKPEPKPAIPRLALNQREAAEALGISAPTLIALTRAGKVPTVCIGARKLYPVREIERWLATTAQQTNAVGNAPEAVAP